MGVDKPSRTTPLFIDVDIATQLLHRSHGEFLDLPQVEKKKLRLYCVVKQQKDEWIDKERNIKTTITDGE